MLSQITNSDWTRRRSDHLLHRAGFGGPPEAREAFYQFGIAEGVEAAIDSLLEETEDWSSLPWLSWALSESDPNGDLYASTGTRRREFTGWYHKLLKEGQPIASKVLKFLADHLPVDTATSTQYKRHMNFFRYYEMLRKHAAGDVDGTGKFGNFKNLITDVSWSEAMIRMLDLQKSQKGAVNENFGRELLELFTLGVDGGYTEDDVGAAAAAFTGRRYYEYQSPHPDAKIKDPAGFAPEGAPPASSYQDVSRQDLDPKSFAGFDKMPDGRDIVTGDDIIDLIFDTPAIQCAFHTCWKLWRYFVAPNPDESLIQNLALSFRDTHHYRIRSLLKEIFMSEAFFDDAIVGKQIKDAGDFIHTLLNQLEVELPSERPLDFIGERLGYDVLYPPNIAGWSEPDGEGNGWLSAGAMVFRMNVASVWTHRNYSILDSNSASVMRSYPSVDWDKIAPPELRSMQNFPMLIQQLNTRFLPFHTLRKSQVRTLFDRFAFISAKIDSLEATKETVRLMLALPEYQMQ